MNPFAALRRRINRLLSLPNEHRRPIDPSLHGRHPDSDRARINRLMMLKIGWMLSFLMLLASFAPDGNHLRLFERLLNTCALADMVLALLLRDRWSTTELSRWDEAILFATISIGLRVLS